MLLVPEDTPILERIDYGDSDAPSSLFTGLNSINSQNPLANPFSLDTPWRPQIHVNKYTKVARSLVPELLVPLPCQSKTLLLHPFPLPLSSNTLPVCSAGMIDGVTDKTSICGGSRWPFRSFPPLCLCCYIYLTISIGGGGMKFPWSKHCFLRRSNHTAASGPGWLFCLCEPPYNSRAPGDCYNPTFEFKFGCIWCFYQGTGFSKVSVVPQRSS